MKIKGKIVNIGSVEPGVVEFDEKQGIIVSVSKNSGNADLDFKDNLIFPGFIDLHVHAREDKSHTQDYKEDFSSASAAAINGGVVAFAEMPNNPAAPVDGKSYKEKSELAKKSQAEVLLYAGIGPDTRPLDFKVPYKAFMGPSIGDLFFKSKADLENTIKNYSGQSVSFHCEDPEILETNKIQSTHERQRPPEAEILAIKYALELTVKHRLRGKICHISTKEGLSLISEAKKRGEDIVCEVAPHHLYFDETMLTDENRKMLQVNPPIRPKEDRLALIKALKDGTIDFLATDHAPHTLEEKQKGISGMPHLDTYSLFACWLLKEQGFAFQDVARVCSYNPGRFFNEFSKIKYGKIEPGFSASFTVIDTNKDTEVESAVLKTKCAWSPFEGVKFSGSVVATVVGGKVFNNSRYSRY